MSIKISHSPATDDQNIPESTVKQEVENNNHIILPSITQNLSVPPQNDYGNHEYHSHQQIPSKNTEVGVGTSQNVESNSPELKINIKVNKYQTLQDQRRIQRINNPALNRSGTFDSRKSVDDISRDFKTENGYNKAVFHNSNRQGKKNIISKILKQTPQPKKFYLYKHKMHDFGSKIYVVYNGI